MDNKELLKALENLNIDENEFDNMNIKLNDLEKKRIKKKYKSFLNPSKNKLKKASLIAGLVLCIGIGSLYVSPVKASNIPVLNSIYELLGIYYEYKNYSQYIGDSIEVKGGKYTLEEILITPYKSLIAIRITGNEPINDTTDNFFISASIEDSYLESSTSSIHKIDDFNIIQVIEGRYNSKVPEKAPINISISPLENPDSPSYFGDATFNINVDFGKSYSEFDSYKISGGRLKGYGLNLKEINSSILGTDILGDIFSFSDSTDYIEKNNNLNYILSVNGDLYGGLTEYSISSLGGLISFGDISVSFNGLKIPDFHSIHNINLSVFKPKYNQNEISEIYETPSVKELIKYNESPFNKITSKGVTYYKTIELFNDRKIYFYNLERNNETLKLHAKLNHSDINLLTNIIATTSDGKEIHYPRIYSSPNKKDEYVIEFSNIKENIDVLILNYETFTNEYELIKEIKIK